MNNLSEKQIQAVKMLSEGQKQAHVARELEVSPRTITRWLTENSKFRQAINIRQIAKSSEMLLFLNPMVEELIGTLKAISDDDMVKPQSRIQAATAVLSLYQKQLEIGLNTEVQGAIGTLQDKVSHIGAIEAEVIADNSLQSEGSGI